MKWTRRHLLTYFGMGLSGAVGASYWLHHKRSVSASSTSLSPQSELLKARSTGVSGVPLPEFQGISDWLNSSPLTVASLKGKVVAVQFWVVLVL